MDFSLSGEDWSAYLNAGKAVKWILVVVYLFLTFFAAVSCVILRKHMRLSLWSCILTLTLSSFRTGTLCIPDSVYTLDSSRIIDLICESLYFITWLIVFLLCVQSSFSLHNNSSSTNNHGRGRNLARTTSLTYQLISSDDPSLQQSASENSSNLEIIDSSTFHQINSEIFWFKIRSSIVIIFDLLPMLSLTASLATLSVTWSYTFGFSSLNSIIRGSMWSLFQLSFLLMYSLQIRKVLPRIQDNKGLKISQTRIFTLVGRTSILPSIKAILSSLDWLFFCKICSLEHHVNSLRAVWCLYLIGSEVIPLTLLLLILTSQALLSMRKSRTFSQRWSARDLQLFTVNTDTSTNPSL